MFKSEPLEQHAFYPSSWHSARTRVVLTFLCVLGVISASRGQNSSSSVEQYANAIRQSTVAGQIDAMERYLPVAENGILKQDALTVLIWDYTRMGSLGHVEQRAKELLALDPSNPVAIAALAEQGANQPVVKDKKKQQTSQKEIKQKVDRAKSALFTLENLRKPEGMGAADFAALRRHVEARLDGVLGLTYVEAEDYQSAKTPLQEAVASDPGNARYAYGLGLSLLLAKENDPGRAYWYLARAVGLSKGTPESSAISEFARKAYRNDGGRDADWQKFLIAAAPPERPAQSAVAYNAPLSASPVSSPSTTTAGNTTLSASAVQPAATQPSTTGTQGTAATSAGGPPANGASDRNAAATASQNSVPAEAPAPVASATIPSAATPAGAVSSSPAPGSGSGNTASAPIPASTRPSPVASVPSHPAVPALPTTEPTQQSQPAETQMAAATAPDIGRQPVTPPRPREDVLSSPNPPVSLGILIETALLTQTNRPGIISTLREVVRHLRPGDEACILVFSTQLDFEQDLTGNDELLTEAMEGLRPRPGRALLEGVAFAAGHLKRIGKNPNRVLLVISDGRNTGKGQVLPASSEISGVKISSIGFNVDDSAGRDLLQHLAEVTGGQTSFVTGPQEFRVAAARITHNIGIPMP